MGETQYDYNRKAGLWDLFGGGETHFSKGETSKKLKTLSPVWDESFELKVNDVGGWISFVVYDYDVMSKDDVIGAHYIRIKDVERASYKPSTLKKYQNIWLVGCCCSVPSPTLSPTDPVPRAC